MSETDFFLPNGLLISPNGNSVGKMDPPDYRDDRYYDRQYYRNCRPNTFPMDYEDYYLSHYYNQMSTTGGWEGKMFENMCPPPPPGPVRPQLGPTSGRPYFRGDPRMSGRAMHSPAHLSPTYAPATAQRRHYHMTEPRRNTAHPISRRSMTHASYDCYNMNMKTPLKPPHKLERIDTPQGEIKNSSVKPSTLYRPQREPPHNALTQRDIVDTPPANADFTEKKPSYSNMVRRNSLRKPLVKPTISLQASPITRPVRESPSPNFSTSTHSPNFSSTRSTPHARSTTTTPCTFSNHTSPHTSPASHQSYDDDMLTNLVRGQLEFYFSDQNLLEEQHSNLQYYMKLDIDQWVPFHIVAALPEVRKLTSDNRIVVEALKNSSLLEYNSERRKVRRPGYVRPEDIKIRKCLRRSVLVYGLPKQMTDLKLRHLLNKHGNILCIAFEGMEDGPEPNTGRTIMKKKLPGNVDEQELSSKKVAFVVYESQSQANKCVKARSRNTEDGIQTMHKYDYNKVAKRLTKGVSPVFTPMNEAKSPNPSSCNTPMSETNRNLTPAPKEANLTPIYNPKRSNRSPAMRSRSAQSSPATTHALHKRTRYSRQGLKTPDPNWNIPDHSWSRSTRSWRIEERTPTKESRRPSRKNNVKVARGPDGTKGFRWPRNLSWRSQNFDNFDLSVRACPTSI